MRGSTATDRLHVGVSLSARAWRANLQRHCRDHESDLVVTLLHQGSDALDGELDLLVVDDETSWLSAPMVEQARRHGLVTIGLFDPTEADGYGQTSLTRLGVDAVLPCTLAVEDLVDALRRHRPDRDLQARFNQLLGIEPPDALAPVIAVGGPAGAGSTEVTLALAAALAATVAERPLVIDVDETHPSVARRLGLGLHPHLLSAVDAHRREPLVVGEGELRSDDADDRRPDHPGGRDPFARSEPLVLRDQLARRAVGSGPEPAFDVIGGLTTKDDWSLVRPGDVVDLIDRAAAHWPAVVVRVGSQLEDLSALTPRYELSRACLAQAGRLVGVGEASASGLLRLVDWLVDALAVVDDQPVDVVLNRAPRSPARRAQLAERLRSITGDRIRDLCFTPTDRRVERAAWNAETVGGGRFVRAIAGLAGAPEHAGNNKVSEGR